MIFALLTLLSALSLAGVAGWFSIIGITAIYAGAPFHAIIMGVVLEAGKLVTTSWLYRNWSFTDWKFKTPLIVFTLILMLATSIGVFGFLSKAHLEQGSGTVDNTAKIERLDQQIAREKSTIVDDEKVVGQLDAAINSYIGKDRTDKSVSVRKNQTPQRNQLRADIDAAQKRIDGFSDEKFKLTSEVRKLQLDVGPIRYIAELFYGTEGDGAKNIELAVRMFTLLIVSTLDPLAVILLIAANHTILRRQNEKEAKNKTPFWKQGNRNPGDEGTTIIPVDSKIPTSSAPPQATTTQTIRVADISGKEGTVDGETLQETLDLQVNEKEKVEAESDTLGLGSPEASVSMEESVSTEDPLSELLETHQEAHDVLAGEDTTISEGLVSEEETTTQEDNGRDGGEELSLAVPPSEDATQSSGDNSSSTETDSTDEMQEWNRVTTGNETTVPEVEINEKESILVLADTQTGSVEQTVYPSSGFSKALAKGTRFEQRRQALDHRTVSWPSIPSNKEINEEENTAVEELQVHETITAPPRVRNPLPSFVERPAREVETDEISSQGIPSAEVPKEVSQQKINLDNIRELVGYTAGPHFVPQRINEEEKSTETQIPHSHREETEAIASIQNSTPEAEEEDIYSETPATDLQEAGDTSTIGSGISTRTRDATEKSPHTPKTLSWLREFKRS